MKRIRTTPSLLERLDPLATSLTSSTLKLFFKGNGNSNPFAHAFA